MKVLTLLFVAVFVTALCLQVDAKREHLLDELEMGDESTMPWSEVKQLINHYKNKAQRQERIQVPKVVQTPQQQQQVRLSPKSRLVTPESLETPTISTLSVSGLRNNWVADTAIVASGNPVPKVYDPDHVAPLIDDANSTDVSNAKVDAVIRKYEDNFVSSNSQKIVDSAVKEASETVKNDLKMDQVNTANYALNNKKDPMAAATARDLQEPAFGDAVKNNTVAPPTPPPTPSGKKTRNLIRDTKDEILNVESEMSKRLGKVESTLKDLNSRLASPAAVSSSVAKERQLEASFAARERPLDSNTPVANTNTNTNTNTNANTNTNNQLPSSIKGVDTQSLINAVAEKAAAVVEQDLAKKLEDAIDKAAKKIAKKEVAKEDKKINNELDEMRNYVDQARATDKSKLRSEIVSAAPNTPAAVKSELKNLLNQGKADLQKKEEKLAKELQKTAANVAVGGSTAQLPSDLMQLVDKEVKKVAQVTAKTELKVSQGETRQQAKQEAKQEVKEEKRLKLQGWTDLSNSTANATVIASPTPKSELDELKKLLEGSAPALLEQNEQEGW